MVAFTSPGGERLRQVEDAIEEAVAVDNGNRFRALLLKHLPRIADAYRQDDEGDAFRSHLGASLLGRACSRELYLRWRWSAVQKHSGRILRLFNRGHMEEARFLALLELIGICLHTPEGDDQERISAVGGHFGSALDGVLYGVPGIPNEWVLGEFKTHNTKSFSSLVAKGMRVSKPEHYTQVQACMALRGIHKTLYLAVNKNDDDIYAELINYENGYADNSLERAKSIIFAEKAPKRVADDPSNRACAYCDFKTRCHFPSIDTLPRNCRTCKSSRPLEDGTWTCDTYGLELSKRMQLAGCSSWDPIPDLVKR